MNTNTFNSTSVSQAPLWHGRYLAYELNLEGARLAPPRMRRPKTAETPEICPRLLFAGVLGQPAACLLAVA